MDRASDSGSEGWGFESLPAYQKIQIPMWVSGFFNTRADSKGRHQCAHWCNQVSGGHLISPWESPSYSRRIRYGCGWDMNYGRYVCFCFAPADQTAYESLPAYHKRTKLWYNFVVSSFFCFIKSTEQIIILKQLTKLLTHI